MYFQFYYYCLRYFGESLLSLWSYYRILSHLSTSFLQMLQDIFHLEVYDLCFIFPLWKTLAEVTSIYNIKLFNLMFYNPIYHRMLILKTQCPYAVTLPPHREMLLPYDYLKTMKAMHLLVDLLAYNQNLLLLWITQAFH